MDRKLVFKAGRFREFTKAGAAASVFCILPSSGVLWPRVEHACRGSKAGCRDSELVQGGG